MYCNQSDKTVCVKSGYWIGYDRSNGGISTYHLMSRFCPYGYCSYKSSKYYKLTYTLPALESHNALDEYICGPERTGTLCGHCSAGYSVFFHSTSYKCSTDYICEFGIVFYIFSEILPITIISLIIIFFKCYKILRLKKLLPGCCTNKSTCAQSRESIQKLKAL